MVEYKSENIKKKKKKEMKFILLFIFFIIPLQINEIRIEH